MLNSRTELNTLLDALTMGVFHNLQVTAKENSEASMPQALNTRMTIPPALEYFKLANGKSTHFVLASLDFCPFGHSVQYSDPGIGLTVPRGQEMQVQQQGEVIDFLLPARH